MRKENKLITAQKELEKAIEKRSFTLYEIRDAQQTISDLGARGYSYSMLSNTYNFFKKLGFKTKCINTYYEIIL